MQTTILVQKTYEQVAIVVMPSFPVIFEGAFVRLFQYLPAAIAEQVAADDLNTSTAARHVKEGQKTEVVE